MSGSALRHTPAPWQWQRGEGVGVWRLAPGVLVCTSGGPAGDRIDQHNATLIQHAPDILAELRELVKEAREHLGAFHASGQEHATYLELAVVRAERLVAKVEGRE